MLQMSVNQFNLVESSFSFTIGGMALAATFFFFQRTEVLPRYRIVVTMLGLVTMMATYNYYRLLESWKQSFTVLGDSVQSTGHVFADTYRYADWLLTVPLLLIAFVHVLDMPDRDARRRSAMLALLAVEMIVLGYPGQIAETVEARWLWWGVSMVPFSIIVYQLYFGIGRWVAGQPVEARKLISGARLLTVVVWCFYPVVYALPLLNINGTNAFIATQVGYAAADLCAKAVYGIIIYMVVARKSVPVDFLAELPAPLLRTVASRS